MDQVGDCHTLGSVQHIDVANSDTSGRPGRPALGPDGPAQDHQLLLLDAESVTELRSRIACTTELVKGPTIGRLDDLAVTLHRGLADRPVRAAVVAASTDQAAQRLARLAAKLGLAARSCPDVPVIPLATDGASVTGVLCAAAAAYVLGAPVRHDPLFTATPTYHGDV